MSTFIPLAVLILLATGWLTYLPTQFGISKQHLQLFLSIISCISLLPPISISSVLDIKLDYFFLFLLFLYTLSQIPIHRLVTLLSLMIMLGSILFLYHEITRTPLLWRSVSFQWFTILFSMSEAIISCSFILEQFCLVFGGLLITQFGLYYLYHERLSPIAFPGLGAMDTFWIIITILIIVKRLQLWVPTIQKTWRIAYWTKKR
ncbi:hypothetical protein [Shimazuella kribbensis]|uniref:hypothetical protein n=1 Tax=Shimazuella kribbensis TaxID=139808 RepID=UPI0003FB4BE6|nr:hypothetical protein [Shimazuella kribbensis]